MDYGREEARRRREYQQQLDRERKLKKQLAEVQRETRSAKSKLLASTIRSETWHRMTLAALDREAGYVGEQAAARFYLRSRSWEEYSRLMAQKADMMPAGTRNIEIEHALVCEKQQDWAIKGNALLLQRAKVAYAAEGASFRKWEHENPDSKGWRSKPATRKQGFLIARMVEVLGIDLPARMNRGDAHDWITQHGGNLRLAADNNDGTPNDTDMSGNHHGASEDSTNSGSGTAE